MKPIGSPETSVENYLTPLNASEDGRIQTNNNMAKLRAFEVPVTLKSHVSSVFEIMFLGEHASGLRLVILLKELCGCSNSLSLSFIVMAINT
jgi:hypothetical protein